MSLPTFLYGGLDTDFLSGSMCFLAKYSISKKANIDFLGVAQGIELPGGKPFSLREITQLHKRRSLYIY